MNLANIENDVLSILENSDTVWQALNAMGDLFAFIKIKEHLESKPIILDRNGNIESVQALDGFLCHSDTKIKIRKQDTLKSLFKRF